MTIPTTMRAVLLTRHGGFDCLDLRDDVPVPQPGAGDVLIRVGAAGVNNTDINTRIGWYSKAVADVTDVGASSGMVGQAMTAGRAQRSSFPGFRVQMPVAGSLPSGRAWT